MKYTNPIIPGFYPDPSICKYKDIYYMVHSSFHYFPGVTLFESIDLLNWKQIGHVLTRESQLPLENAYRSGGIFAPTIRCHKGRFYMVTTNICGIGNFYVYTDDIYGEWSEPILVEQGGIDPSLYFEDDRCYFMSNGKDDQGEEGITQCEIDVDTGKKLTNSICIWKGTGGRYLEAPHLYKINGSYYLIAAEGGTEYGHMIVYAKGNSPYGPFISAPNNPVLSNRNLGGYEIQGCGHGDLIKDNYGNWWMVHLAFRQTGLWNMYHITGRETYLVEATWCEEGWLSLGDEGTTRLEVETDRLSDDLLQVQKKYYGFIHENMYGNPYCHWSYIRNPIFERYELSKDCFELEASMVKIEDQMGSPSFIGMRQHNMEGHVSCKVDVSEEMAGITIYMDDLHHYDLYVNKTEDGVEIQKRICIGGMKYIQERMKCMSEEIISTRLQVDFTPTEYHFKVEYNGILYDFGSNDTRYLSSEVASGFTGVMIGLFAQSDRKDNNKAARFTEFICEYK